MTAKRIVVDHSAGFGQGAGIGRYARNIVKATAAELLDAHFTLWYAPEPDAGAGFAVDALDAWPGQHAPRVVRSRFERRRMNQIWFRAHLPVPIELWAGRCDLVYSPDFTAPPSLRVPTTITVHDLAYEIAPERAPEALRNYLSSVVPAQVCKARTVFAVSETTKRDLIERYGADDSRIVVAPNAADTRFFDSPPLTVDQRASLGLPSNYLLMVATIEPRKNHVALFEAISQLAPDATPPVVIVGRAGWQSESILEIAHRLQDSGRVILLNYVDDRLLPGLYAGAHALVYPAWYEGFGLPIVEALAAGIPVIASDVAAHREVAGDEAEYIDPNDSESLADAIRRVTESTSNESEVVERRRNRASRYSWEHSGKIVARAFREILTT